MYKPVAVWGIVILLCWAGHARAQGPLLQRGTQELAVSGTYDVQRDSRAFLDLTGRYGYFLRNELEVGGFAEISGNFDTFFRYGVSGALRKSMSPPGPSCKGGGSRTSAPTSGSRLWTMTSAMIMPRWSSGPGSA